MYGLDMLIGFNWNGPTERTTFSWLYVNELQDVGILEDY